MNSLNIAVDAPNIARRLNLTKALYAKFTLILEIQGEILDIKVANNVHNDHFSSTLVTVNTVLD